MSKAKLLNVKKHLEHILWSTEDMLNRDSQNKLMGVKTGIGLPPIDVENLKHIRFITKRILAVHSLKNTRKDIYIEKS